MSALIFVRDGRTLPYIPVTIAALQAIRKTCEQRRADDTRRSFPHALATYMALLELANEDRSDRAAVSQKDIGERAGCSRSTVQGAISDLATAGVLDVHERHHGATRVENEYVVIEPAGQSATDCTPARQKGDPRPSERQHAHARPSPPTEAQAIEDCEEEQTEEARERADVVPTDQVGALFDYWREHCEHPQARPTAERTSKIRARLKDGYTPQQIRTAIDGAARAPFVSPDNGKRFDDVELICRTGAKLEDFIGRASLPANGGATNVHQLQPRTVSELRYLDKREQERRSGGALAKWMAEQEAAKRQPDHDVEGEATEL
jgi:biotin operon repressor